jgi:hypothetical protein
MTRALVALASVAVFLVLRTAPLLMLLVFVIAALRTLWAP